MMTHRWLGTSTDVLAVVTLLLGEASRRPGEQRARRWFGVLLIVVALMVLAAGFVGGAMVYGIRHYEWALSDSLSRFPSHEFLAGGLEFG